MYKVKHKGAKEMQIATVNPTLKLKHYESVVVSFPFPICRFDIGR